ncbi:hypothetical protein [uncultured Nonlabens sp.]|uniref:hypothetical protein n=1 Tax=uncultured Nonlabens sp. TaxID=859306 RepID=UPI0030DD3D81|tara:strand:- start:8522 stop:9439 length:918 start_codon:yes stop_codon:yes gene_type:complete
MKKIFKLNPENTLTQQWLFWLVNGILFLFALILIGIIWNKGNYYINWSPEGFRFFISEFAFPISILAIIIPATALIATMHRSSQLSTQINLLMQQNNFANYYKHYEMFQSYYAELCNDNDILNEKKCDKIYRRLFPNSKKGDYSVDITLLKSINKLSKEYLEILEKLNNNEKITYFEFILFSSDIVFKISESWGGYWLTPMEFGNTIIKTIPDIDESKVEPISVGNISAKFINADSEDVIFEKTLNYFKLIAKLLEFEITLGNDDLSNDLYLLINKQLVMFERADEKRIASRIIHFVTATRLEQL